MSGPVLYWIGELAVAALIVIGAFFLLVGSYGLAKLPDTMRRLHGPTKAATLGIGSLLIASMLYFLLARGHLSFRELLITIFLFLTAPVTALMVAKAHILRDRNRRRELPPPGRPVGWATLDPPPKP
ncbi:MAG: Na+/H+ antiporter subunit G [Alphaproteobacteria bacterium]